MDRYDRVAPHMMRAGIEDFWQSDQRLSKGAAPSASYLWKFPASGLVWDEKAAYTNPNFPWIQAVWKVYIKGSLPVQSHVVRVEFPRTLSVLGPHIAQFQWRGYIGCTDVEVLGDDKVVQNTSAHMYGYSTGNSWKYVRFDHTQYDIGTYRLAAVNPRGGHASWRTGCWVVPPPGALSSDGLSHEEALDSVLRRCLTPPRKHTCEAVVCVPIAPPPHVTFAERNIPTSEEALVLLQGIENKCNAVDLDPAKQPAGSQVCYGLNYVGGPAHDGLVGDQWTTSDDPRDDIFYSTMFLKRKEWKFDSPECGEDCGSTQKPPPWRFHDKCISCEDAHRNANTSYTGVAGSYSAGSREHRLPQWRISDKCEVCNRNKVALRAPPAPPPAPPCLVEGCVDVPPPSGSAHDTCEAQSLSTTNCEKRVAGTLSDGYCALTCGVCARCPPSSPPPSPPPYPPPCEQFCLDVEPPSDWRLNSCAAWKAELLADVEAVRAATP